MTNPTKAYLARMQEAYCATYTNACKGSPRSSWFGPDGVAAEYLYAQGFRLMSDEQVEALRELEWLRQNSIANKDWREGSIDDKIISRVLALGLPPAPAKCPADEMDDASIGFEALRGCGLQGDYPYRKTRGAEIRALFQPTPPAAASREGDITPSAQSTVPSEPTETTAPKESGVGASSAAGESPAPQTYPGVSADVWKEQIEPSRPITLHAYAVEVAPGYWKLTDNPQQYTKVHSVTLTSVVTP